MTTHNSSQLLYGLTHWIERTSRCPQVLGQPVPCDVEKEARQGIAVVPGVLLHEVDVVVDRHDGIAVVEGGRGGGMGGRGEASCYGVNEIKEGESEK